MVEVETPSRIVIESRVGWSGPVLELRFELMAYFCSYSKKSNFGVGEAKSLPGYSGASDEYDDIEGEDKIASDMSCEDENAPGGPGGMSPAAVVFPIGQFGTAATRTSQTIMEGKTDRLVGQSGVPGEYDDVEEESEAAAGVAGSESRLGLLVYPELERFGRQWKEVRPPHTRAWYLMRSRKKVLRPLLKLVVELLANFFPDISQHPTSLNIKNSNESEEDGGDSKSLRRRIGKTCVYDGIGGKNGITLGVRPTRGSRFETTLLVYFHAKVFVQRRIRMSRTTGGETLPSRSAWNSGGCNELDGSEKLQNQRPQCHPAAGRMTKDGTASLGCSCGEVVVVRL